MIGSPKRPTHVERWKGNKPYHRASRLRPHFESRNKPKASPVIGVGSGFRGHVDGSGGSQVVGGRSRGWLGWNWSIALAGISCVVVPTIFITDIDTINGNTCGPAKAATGGD